MPDVPDAKADLSEGGALALERRGVSSGIYLDGLTGLRGFAALWVALWHIWQAAGPRPMVLDLGGLSLDLTPLIRTGWAGVDIFFVLSGFLLALPFCRARLGLLKRVSLKEFYRRRLLRVFPAYYAQIAVLVLLAALGIAGTVPALGDLLSHLLMIHNFWGAYQHSINGVYWTLPIEFDFYLILPLMVLLLRPGRWWLLPVGAFLIVVLYRYASFGLIADQAVGVKVWILSQLPGRLDQFAAGIVAAYIYTRIGARGGDVGPRIAGALTAAGAAGLLALAYYLHYRQPLGSVVNPPGETFWGGHWSLFVWHGATGVFVALLILGVALGCRVGAALLANRAMISLGLISYSLYLWHYPLIQWLAPLFEAYDGYRFPVLLGGLALPILAVSALSFQLVEKPFLKLRHRAAR